MRAKRIASAAILGVLMLSVLVFIPVPQVHAFTNAPVWSSTVVLTACTSTTYTITMAETDAANDPILLSIGDGKPNYVSGVSDNLGDAWALANRGGQPAGYSIDAEVWYVASANPGSLTTVTVTWSATPTLCIYTFAQFDTGPIGLTSTVFNNWNQCNNAGCTITATSSASFPAGSFAFMTAYGCGNSLGCSGAGVSVYAYATGGLWVNYGVGAPTCYDGLFAICSGWFFSTVKSTSPVAMYCQTVGSTTNSNCTLTAAVFSTGQTITVPPTVQTLGCQSHNATAFTGKQNHVYYIEAQAPPSGTTVFNVTAYLKAIATAPVTIALGVYLAGIVNSSTPGYGTQAFTLAPGGEYSASVPITAGNVKFSYQPSIAVAGYKFYLIAVAQTDSGSGTFKLLEGASGKFYNTTATAVGGLPSQINVAGASSSSHVPCLSANALIAGTTIYINGGGGSTASTTSTFYVNQPNPSNLNFWYIPFFFLMVFPAVFIAAGRMIKGK